MENRRISMCIPTWERDEILFESFAEIIGDERVGSVFISDDASGDTLYKNISSKIDLLNQFYDNKITIERNSSNQDCFFNKRTSVMGAKHEWVLLGDSDNIFGVDYLDTIYSVEEWDKDTVYCPVWAKPQFDYLAFEGLTIDRHNINQYVNQPMFLTALNTMNFFINKKAYLEVWSNEIDPVTSDSLWFNYLWLLSGRKIHFLKNLTYQHRVHSGSHYQNNHTRTGALASEIEINFCW